MGVQLVARKWEEEKVWAIAKVVYAALREMEGSHQAPGEVGREEGST